MKVGYCLVVCAALADGIASFVSPHPVKQLLMYANNVGVTMSGVTNVEKQG